ncbi:hypothetical protein BG011_002954 [Mortierella polycephala]|uniref:PH domain-containing protein n=1 Tax=Mortierella polycephala TaxID=41804 RepID=A0A9P6QDV9_9FUNG|nr:hypothetical protein BG011_002954 [Mortierella polycephala]
MTTTAATSVVIPSAAENTIDQCCDSDAEAGRDNNDQGACGAISKDTLQEGQILKAGYLVKKGERIKMWKKKWFVLRTSKLAYYKDDKEYELLRIIDIRDIHRAAEVEIKHKSGAFVILTPRRTFTVQAGTIDEMQDWVHAINQAKAQFEFAASNSDLDSCVGSTVHLGQQLPPLPIPHQMFQQQQQKQHKHSSAPNNNRDNNTKQPISGIVLPRKQLQPSLSLSNPDLLNNRKQSSKKGKNAVHSLPPRLAIPSSSPSSGTSSTSADLSVLDRPSPSTARAGAPRRADRLLSITTAGTNTASGALTKQNASPSSPRMEHVHSDELVIGPLSSAQTFTFAASGANAMPGTPVSPGYYSGGEYGWMTGDNNLSSGEEEEIVDDDPSFLEAGRLASEANAPGSGIVTSEQLESKVVRQGYLLKLGNKYKTWRKKWFVLRGDKLTYYKNTKTDPVSKSKLYCLRIVTSKRSFVCCAPDEDTLLQWLDALHVECGRVAREAHKEAIADQQAQDAALEQQQLVEDVNEGDDEGTKPLGRTALLKKNLHNTLPRPRSISRSRTKSSESGSTGPQQQQQQVRKVLSLESAAATSATPTVSFQIPNLSNMPPALPAPSATMTFSA